MKGDGDKGGSIRFQSMVLGAANMGVTGLRFIMPMVLVRLLTAESYGQYRLFWLLAITVNMIAPLGLPRGLLYFIPRLDAAGRQRYVHQTIFLLAISGLVSAVLVSPLNPFLPKNMAEAGWGLMAPAFIFLWVLGFLLDFLNNAEERIVLQAGVLVGFEMLRLMLVAGAALLTRDIRVVLWALMAYALAKVLYLLATVGARYGVRCSWPRLKDVKDQFAFSLPLGLATFLTNFRGKAEHWVAGILFAPEVYAVFAVGAVEIPVLKLLRKTVGQVVFPKMSRAQSKGDHQRALALLQGANLACAYVMFPLSAFVFAFATPLVELLFTADYLNAVPVLRLYLVIMAMRAISLTNVMMIYNQKGFYLKVTAGLLVVSIGLSYAGVKMIGLPGVVLGSVITSVVQGTVMHMRASKVLGVSVKALERWRDLIATGLASACAVGGAYVLVWSLGPLPLWQQAVLGMLVAVVAYLAMAQLLGLGWLFRVVLGKGRWEEGNR